MEQEKAESYRALYRVRPLIYHIGDIRLWMPIRQDGVVLWLVYIMVFFVLCYIIPILSWLLPFDRLFTMAVGPIAAAFYTVKLDPAGKTVPGYLRDMLYFLVRPKWFVRWQAIRQLGGKGKVKWESRCRSYDRISSQGESEIWQGRMAAVQGHVDGLQSLVLPARSQVKWHGRTKRLSIAVSKHRSEKDLVLPTRFVGKGRGKRVWATAKPVQVLIERDFTNQEIWQVKERDQVTETR